MMEEDRVGIASIRPPQDDYVSFFHGSVGTRATSRSEDRRQTDDAGSVSSAVTAVNIVTADYRASEFLRHKIHLVRRLRATKHPDRRPTVFINDLLKT
jgi:hypothetical protein